MIHVAFLAFRLWKCHHFVYDLLGKQFDTAQSIYFDNFNWK